MLSLAPRFDTFRFQFPKEFLDDSVYEKYTKLLRQRKFPMDNALDYLNESIQGVELFGIDGSVIEQKQTFKNSNLVETGMGLGKALIGRNTIRTEPASEVYYRSPANPLVFLSKQLTVTFRHNQGFINYFMMMENWFKLYAKEQHEIIPNVWYIEVLDDMGVVQSRIKLSNPLFNGLDNLSLSYDKATRDASTFTATFNYSNIDYEFVGLEPYYKDGQMAEGV